MQEQKNRDFLKISKAADLSGMDKKIYRVLEILPGFLSWSTLLSLIIFSYFYPVYVAYFVVAFDIYWLLLVVYLGIHLVVSYIMLKRNLAVDWKKKCESIIGWERIRHLVILPTYNEGLDVLRSTFDALAHDSYPNDKMIVVLAIEERAGQGAKERARTIEREYGHIFGRFLVTIHPDDIVGELKGKGSNQAWAAKKAKEQIIDPENMPYGDILVSVFDIDTIVISGYFHRLTYAFLTVENPYRASYQPIPMYHNNLWQAPFFSRVAARSNTFWQMMQQIRDEKMVTYSSHSMTWQALVDIGFWSTNMVSEDSRIFYNCFVYYDGDYRVEPLYFPISMDVTMDTTPWKTMKSLYIQQRRWGWGAENVAYLIFNFIKRYKQSPKYVYIRHIMVQIYGFHSWATNALITAFVGWLPIILGGERFRQSVLSSNLPSVTQFLMTFAMVGLVISTIVSTLLLPPRPRHYGFGKTLTMVLQWTVLPLVIICFGSFPALEAQTRLMFGKYMGFWVTPKKR